MATATVKTKLVPQPPILTPVPDKKEVVGVTLELTMEEASLLRFIIGCRVTNDSSGPCSSSLYTALKDCIDWESNGLKMSTNEWGTWWLVKR